jgi:hypothetical protein
MAKKGRRTEMRSSAGKKLYAVRDKEGKFKDIQTYERAHRADMAHKSAAELKTAAKKGAAKNGAATKSASKIAAPKMAKKKAPAKKMAKGKR